MKIPFTLEAWLKDKSQKVETREGRPVKIISFEMTDTNDCPIAAQFRLCAGTPVVYLFDKEGHYKGEGDSDYDLFLITPEEEMTEFEKAFQRIIESWRSDNSPYKDEMSMLLHKDAAELLELARKELNLTIGDYGQGYSAGYIDGKKEGKAEALKDLPRWEKCADCCLEPKPSNEWIFSIDSENVTRESAIVHNGYFLPLFGLEKLPGFNET